MLVYGKLDLQLQSSVKFGLTYYMNSFFIKMYINLEIPSAACQLFFSALMLETIDLIKTSTKDICLTTKRLYDEKVHVMIAHR